MYNDIAVLCSDSLSTYILQEKDAVGLFVVVNLSRKSHCSLNNGIDNLFNIKMQLLLSPRITWNWGSRNCSFLLHKYIADDDEEFIRISDRHKIPSFNSYLRTVFYCINHKIKSILDREVSIISFNITHIDLSDCWYKYIEGKIHTRLDLEIIQQQPSNAFTDGRAPACLIWYRIRPLTTMMRRRFYTRAGVTVMLRNCRDIKFCWICLDWTDGWMDDTMWSPIDFFRCTHVNDTVGNIGRLYCLCWFFNMSRWRMYVCLYVLINSL